jgi:hypothetical protein
LPSATTRYTDSPVHELRERYPASYGGDEIAAPVESIAETLLGLGIDEDDLGECSGMSAECLIKVNASEAMSRDIPTRRHRFTVAHKLRHWICHASKSANPAPSYCRSHDMARDVDSALEREANVFGADLLMSEAGVREACVQLEQKRGCSRDTRGRRKKYRLCVRCVHQRDVVPPLQLLACADQA